MTRPEDMFLFVPTVEDTGCRDGLALAVAFASWSWEMETAV